MRIKKASQGVTNALTKEVQHRRALYQERDTMMHSIRRLRLMRHEPMMPKSFQRWLKKQGAVKMPIMYRMVQTAVSAVAKRFPTVYVESLSAADRKPAAELSRASALLLQALETASNTPYLYNLYFTLFGDGLGVTKTQGGAWSGFPLPSDDEDMTIYNERVVRFLADHPLPFVSRVVDPLTCYPPLNEYGRGVFVESSWRSTEEVMHSLGLVPDSNGLGFHIGTPSRIPEGHPYSELELPPGFPPTVRVDEVWGDDECAILMHGCNDVWLFENPMGEKPYSWAYADPTGVMDPANVGMSVVFPLHSIAPWIDTMTGIMLAWSLFAAPTPYTTQDHIPGVRPTQETKVETFQPGKMYHFGTARKPGILSPANVGEPVLNFLNFLIESSDRGGLPALVSGSGIGTRLPALTFQAAFEAAIDRLRPAVQSAETVVAQTLRKCMRIVGRYNIPVKVNGWEYTDDTGDRSKRAWATIRPAEAVKDRRVVVSLAVDSTQDLIAKGTHAQFMVAAKLWDVARAMRFSGDDNPELTKDRIDADDARRAMAPYLIQALIASDPEMGPLMQAAMEGAEGEPPGPGRNRKGVPAGRGGGKRGGPTQKPRGRRQGVPGSTYGRS